MYGPTGCWNHSDKVVVQSSILWYTTMNYMIQLNGHEKIGTVPTPEELQILIKAALASVPQYEVYDVDVRKVGTGSNLAGDRNWRATLDL